MTGYRIFFADGRSTDLAAARVYFGWKRFYLYDEQSNVVGSFSWEQLSGFQTISGPVQQIILQDHDDLPQDRKSKGKDREASLKKQKGEYLYELEGVAEQLKEVSARVSSVWLMADVYRRSKSNELTLLLEHSKGEVQRLQASIIDTQKNMETHLRRLSEEITRSLRGDFKP